MSRPRKKRLWQKIGLHKGFSADEEAAFAARRRAYQTRKPHTLPSYLCSRELRRQILTRVPAAQQCDVLRRYVGFALFDARRFGSGEQRPIGVRTLAAISGLDPGRPIPTRQTGLRVLERLRSHLPGLAWARAYMGSPREPPRPRLLVRDGLPQALHALVEAELLTPLRERGGLVDFVSGRRVPRARLSAAEAPDAEAPGTDAANGTSADSSESEAPASLRAPEAPCEPEACAETGGTAEPATAELLAYLNTRDVRGFRREVNRGIRAARQVAMGLEPAARARALRHLDRIELCPRPHYRATGGTVRVYAGQDSLQYLRRDVRAALLPTWVKFDLRHAQLAVAACRWPVPELDAYLPEPGSDGADRDFWGELFSSIGAEALYEARSEGYEAVKGALKEALYRTAYGGGRAKTKKEVDAAEGAIERHLPGRKRQEVLGLVLAHPALRALVRGRNRRLAELRAAGEAVDTFGHRIMLAGRAERGRTVARADAARCRSALVRLAQAEELALLRPSLELARRHPGAFQIMLWQHDGFYAAFADRTTRPYWTGRIVREVAAECERRGIRTRLEVALPGQK